MSVSTNDLKNGITLDLDGTLFSVIEFQHVKPGKGGAFVRTKLRNVKTGAVIEKTFNAGVKVGMAVVDKSEMQFLYPEGDQLVFMDLATYDQIHVPMDVIGDARSYVSDGQTAMISVHDGSAIAIDLPASVVLEVTESDPGVKGDRVAGALKPATLSTGLVVQVPLFIEPGERLKIDTRTGDYIERVK